MSSLLEFFGLPIVASDVGSLKEDIIAGRTGFLFQPLDAVSLVKCIETYFSSELYRELETRRQDIKDFAAKKYSWTTVSEITQSVYKKLLAQR
jgi:glycosyltransferase involved in cell wall biosynthesis